MGEATSSLGLSNVKTSVMGRIASNTQVSKQEIDELVALALKHISYDSRYIWNASINGVIVQLVTNNYHLMDFWVENWFPAPLQGIQPQGMIYAAMGVPGEKPYSYYCSEAKTAVFINTDYYGQCKSWALGIVADILEMQHGIHSIHGAVVDLEGYGICIIAPTGTGKSTQSYGLILNIPAAKLHSDDWCYVEHIGNGDFVRAARASISERTFYLRTDIADGFPRMAELFSRCKLENVGETYSSVRNSRAILDPTWIAGAERFTHVTDLKAVILLRRDDKSPAEVKLEADEAIEILKKGEYMVLPGAGPKEDWGKIKSEPFYNPYLLVRNEERTQLQEKFFRKTFRVATCHILNTGVETIEESQQRILRIAREAMQEAQKIGTIGS